MKGSPRRQGIQSEILEVFPFIKKKEEKKENRKNSSHILCHLNKCKKWIHEGSGHSIQFGIALIGDQVDPWWWGGWTVARSPLPP